MTSRPGAIAAALLAATAVVAALGFGTFVDPATAAAFQVAFFVLLAASAVATLGATTRRAETSAHERRAREEQRHRTAPSRPSMA